MIHVNRNKNHVVSNKIEHNIIQKNIFTKPKQQTINTMSYKKFNNIVKLIISQVKEQSIPLQINEIYNRQRKLNANVILRKDKTRHDLVKFLHGAMCSPVPSTWIRVINNNNFTT